MLNQINPKINVSVTLPNGYFVQEKGIQNNQNAKGIAKLLNKLEKSNTVLSANAIETLSTLDKLDFEEISSALILHFKPTKGNFLRPTFASGEEISDEEFTYEDFCTQIEMYFFSYGLGIIPEHLFKPAKGRKIELDNISKRKDKKELNKTFKIIDVKSIKEFSEDVKNIMEMPIVFGPQQVELIKEAHDNGLLLKIFEGN